MPPYIQVSGANHLWLLCSGAGGEDGGSAWHSERARMPWSPAAWGGLDRGSLRHS